MIRKYTLEILDGNNLTSGNYFGYTKNRFSLNCFNEVSDKATEGL